MSSIAEQFREQVNKKNTLREQNLAMGRKNLRTFCNLRKPDFYMEVRSETDIERVAEEIVKKLEEAEDNQ